MAAGQTEKPRDDEQRVSMLSQISKEMVRIYKDLFGRGPTRVRTHWCSDELLIVLLEDTFTPAERNLVRMGEHERLRESRMFFQYASVPDFCEPVERLTGRKVRAFISGIDTAVDGISTEMFVLYPEGADARSRIHPAGV